KLFAGRLPPGAQWLAARPYRARHTRRCGSRCIPPRARAGDRRKRKPPLGASRTVLGRKPTVDGTSIRSVASRDLTRCCDLLVASPPRCASHSGKQRAPRASTGAPTLSAVRALRERLD